jgi:hypothetical protein
MAVDGSISLNAVGSTHALPLPLLLLLLLLLLRQADTPLPGDLLVLPQLRSLYCLTLSALLYHRAFSSAAAAAASAVG